MNKKRKTHCIQGHALIPENIKVRTDGSHRCKECVRAEQRKHYAKHRVGELIRKGVGISEVTFLEWCAERDVRWSLATCGPHDEYTSLHYVLWILWGDKEIEAEGWTPSEVREEALRNAEDEILRRSAG